MNIKLIFRRSTAIFSLLLLLFATNLWVNSLFVKIDLTRDRKYSLSSSTKSLLNSLGEQIDITAYFSRNINGEVEEKVRYLENFLNEIELCSKGRVRVTYVDPNKLSEERIKKIEKKGIAPLTVNIREDDKYISTKCYLGLVISSVEHSEVVPALVDDSRVEYELFIKIAAAADHKKGKVGFITLANDSNIDENSFSLLTKSLKKVYGVFEVDNSLNQDDIDLLIVLGDGEELSNEKLKILDKKLCGGTPVLILMDSWKIHLYENKREEINGKLKKFLAFHGITLNSELVHDMVNARSEFKTWLRPVTLNYPYHVVSNSFNGDVDFLNSLNSAVLPFPSSIETINNKGEEGEENGLIFTPLLFSSSASHLYTPEELDPTGFFVPPINATKGPFVLGALFSGQFSSFINGEKSSNVGNMVLLTGLEGFKNGHFEDNQPLLLNIIDGLVGDEGLISIRSKNIGFAPLKATSSTTKKVIKYFNLFFSISLITIFWIWRVMKRKQDEYLPYEEESKEKQ